MLKWWEFREHLSEVQQQQVMEVVKLATEPDRNKVELASEYVQIVAINLPDEVKTKLVTIVARGAASGAGSSPRAIAQINAAFPDAISKSPDLRALVLPCHPRLFHPDRA